MPKLEKLTPHNDGKKRKMKMTKLTAIALCERGANQHAHATFFKSAHKPKDKKKDSSIDVEKKAMLVSDSAGHSHLIDISDHEKFRLGGHTDYSSIDGEEYSHNHPFVINEDGSITIGMAKGHTHTTSGTVQKAYAATKSSDSDLSDSANENAADIGGGQVHKEDITMPKDKNADDNTAKKELDTVKKQLATATALATLTDAQKNYYNGLDDADKDSFLEKDANARQVEIVTSLEKDEVIYKATDGTQYRKSDDPRLVHMAKKMDTSAKETAIEKAKVEKLALEKRANEDFKNLPGDLATRVALIKAADSIEDETIRTAALDSLKAKNASNAGAFQTHGTSAQVDTDETSVGKAAEDKMDTLTKKYMADNDEPDYFEAYDKVSKIHPETYAAAVAG